MYSRVLLLLLALACHEQCQAFPCGEGFQAFDDCNCYQLMTSTRLASVTFIPILLSMQVLLYVKKQCTGIAAVQAAKF